MYVQQIYHKSWTWFHFACADDIGAVVHSLEGLKRLFKLFSLMKKASGLTLKPSKCILIPLACDASPENIEGILGWLRVNIPEWSHMCIRNMGKYLGVVIGPGVLPDTNWESPSLKFQERAAQVASSGLPASLIPYQYMSKAVSALGYIGQMFGLPSRFRALELRIATKLLGFATNSLTTRAAYNLDHFGGPSLTRPSTFLHACRARACLKTFKGFAEMHQNLVDAHTNAATLAHLVPNAAIPDGWRSQALCTNLDDMFQGKVVDLDYPDLGRIIIRHRARCETVPGHQDGLQKKIALDLARNVPNGWPSLITRRFPCLGIPPLYTPASDFTKYFLRISCGLPPQVRMIAMKTWSHSWATTERFHEEHVLGCIFGCGGGDNLRHYLRCDVLWTLVIGSAIPEVRYLLPSVTPDLLPAYRACLLNADRSSIVLLSLAFKLYHALKLDHRMTIDSAFARHEFDEVLDLSLDLIEFFILDFPSLRKNSWRATLIET